MNFKLLFANYLSVLPLIYSTVIGTYYGMNILQIVPPIFTFKYVFGYYSSIIVSQLLKYLLHPMFEFTKRPQGACGCDYNSFKGDSSGNPGFPSGHMATTGFFVTHTLLVLLKKNNIKIKENRIIFIILNILLLLLMGWARHYKKCHSLIQIIAGTILGTILGYLFFFF